MIVEIIPCLSDNYSYVIHEKETGTTSIVDPSEFEACDKVINKYKKLDFILNTHHHADHVGANLELKKKYNSKILGSSLDKGRIPGLDIFLRDNQKQKIGNLMFEVIFIPGHTKGHIAFFFNKEKIAFTGDTLFSLGCGRIFEGTPEMMYQSLNKLKNLPENTRVYCGHEYTLNNALFLESVIKDNDLSEKIESLKELYDKKQPSIPTTIKEEKKLNFFLKSNEESFKNHLNMNKANDLEVFTYLRHLKDTF